MKSREEIEGLKRQWLSDTNWDIETTEGFEEHTSELLKFRLDTERKFQEKEERRVLDKCLKLDISPELLKYIEGLEYQVKRLAERIERLENPDGEK